MKRVYTLYRVSTTQQVDVIKDDIPMQRIACHEFAEKMGWTILKEKEEKGIDTAVKMIIAVVLGSLLLTGLYQLFNSVVLPGLADRIQSMF